MMQGIMWPLLKLTRMTCRDAFRLSSERMDGPLRFRDSLRLRMHLIVCGICRHLPAQFESLRCLMRTCNHEEIPKTAESEPLTDEAKEKIREQLKQHGSK